MSPVMYQPSVHHLGGLLGLVEIAEHPVGALHQQQARLARRQQARASSGSTIRTATPGSGCPTVPALGADLANPCRLRNSGAFTATTGDISVQP